MPANPRLESEANDFACYLLMPENFFIPDLIKMRDELKDEDKLLFALSKRYDVPIFAVARRIALLTKIQLKQIRSGSYVYKGPLLNDKK